MPNYTNAVAATSQAHTYVASLTFLYDNIALIPGIPHKYQIEVERIFTTARAGSPVGIVAFQSDAAVPVEQKRDVYIIPETLNNNTYLTFNETAKTITIAADLSTLNKVYTNPSNTIYVPNIVAGQVITFRRKTISNTPLVTWSSGTKLTSNQLNLETTQLLYLVQEVLDRVYRQISISGDIVSQIADNAITTSKIVDLNVTTIKINDLAVTTAKLADLNVTTGKINDLAVTTAKIADYNITPAKLINTTQAWSLTGTLALTDLATSATGDKVANKNYVLDRISKYGIITKDSTVTSNVLDTPPTIPTDANDDVSLQSGGIWFNPKDGGLRVRVLDKWVRVTGTPLNITDYISTGAIAQTKTGNLTLNGDLTVDTNTLYVNSTSNYVNIGTTNQHSKLTLSISNTANDGFSLIATQNNDFLKLLANTGSGSYNPLTLAGDKCFMFGKQDGSADSSGLCIIPWTSAGAHGMRITYDGKVGINKNNPSTSLDVNGTITATNFVGNGIVPVGSIFCIAHNTQPDGYLICNGQSVSTTTYPALHAVIGYTYGGSGGSFNVPDLRGEFVRGFDAGRGVDSGRALGSAQAQDWKGFYQTNTIQTGSGGWAHNNVYMGKTTYPTSYTGNLFTGKWESPGTAIGTAWDSSEIRPRNIAFVYIIKT